MLRMLLLITTCLTLSGCVTQGKLGTLPKVENLTTACDVYIIRKSTMIGAALSYTVAIDHHDFVAITSGHYTNIKVDCGPHVITVKYPRQLFLGTAESSLEFECQPSKKIYISLWPGLAVNLAVLSDEEGVRLVQKSEYIDVQ